MTLQKLFLTFGAAGLSPKIPATVGTLASLPVGLFVLYMFGMETLFMLTLAIIVIGIFEINKYEQKEFFYRNNCCCNSGGSLQRWSYFIPAIFSGDR